MAEQASSNGEATVGGWSGSVTGDDLGSWQQGLCSGLGVLFSRRLATLWLICLVGDTGVAALWELSRSSESA